MRNGMARILWMVCATWLVWACTECDAQELDFGDAPDPAYQTLAASDGARHIIAGPWLGDANDAPEADADGKQDANALGDDFDGNDDEDGFSFPPLIRGRSATINFEVSGASGVVEIWVDLNADGTWQHPDEIIHLGTYAVGNHAIAYTMPQGTQDAGTFARCRISTAGTGAPTGEAADGEVEDHNVFLNDGIADWCNLQFPPNQQTRVSQPTALIYGQVWINGETSKGGATPGLVAQLGYGPDGSDPATSPDWKWVNATYNLDVGNNDEYMSTLTVAQAGVYDYAFRYAWFGGPFVFGDLDGLDNGYDPAQAGSLVVLPQAECSNWFQPRDCEYGVALTSEWRTNAPDNNVAADDFMADGRAITGIRWWGTYGQLVGTTPPGGPGGRPDAFELRWYTDVPAGQQAAWSMPGTLITNLTVAVLPFGTPRAGSTGAVSEAHVCTVPNSGEIFAYEVTLPQPWLEQRNRIYWLSVRAIYSSGPPVSPLPWGWATTPTYANWNDAAVRGVPSAWTNQAFRIVGHPYNNQPMNLAFELLTEVCPRRCLIWTQPPQLETSIDMPSWRRESDAVTIDTPLRADDFLSDGRRITDIHWWGSYMGWESGTEGQNPVAPPTGSDRPIGFDLSWHAQASGACLPGTLITNLFVPIALCQEGYFGTVDQSEWFGEAHFEHEYQYAVDLLNEAVSGLPWPELAGSSYWINIQAVFPDAFIPEGVHQGWGWATTPALEQCESAVTEDGETWQADVLPPPHPSEGEAFDLAFELTTIDIPPTNSAWFEAVFITNITTIGFQAPFITNLTAQVATNNVYWIASSGDCGCGVQKLQGSTNLLLPGSGYVDLATNHLPRTQNLWRAATTNRNAYYRVLQAD